MTFLSIFLQVDHKSWSFNAILAIYHLFSSPSFTKTYASIEGNVRIARQGLSHAHKVLMKAIKQVVIQFDGVQIKSGRLRIAMLQRTWKRRNFEPVKFSQKQKKTYPLNNHHGKPGHERVQPGVHLQVLKGFLFFHIFYCISHRKFNIKFLPKVERKYLSLLLVVSHNCFGDFLEEDLLFLNHHSHYYFCG
jgi:hypothetical protein